MIVNPMYTASLNEQQRTWFYAEYEAAKKDEVVGVLLALFLGVFGIHKFYMGETGWGVLYILLSWTGISAFLGFIECFLMPGRVRAYNAVQAQIITNGIMATNIPAYASSSTTPPPAANPTPAMCPSCGGAVQSGASFCAKCGSGMAATA
jgi:TM2 domain-containing membrane protein YozV